MPDYTLSAKGTFDGSNFASGLKQSSSALDQFKSKCDSVSSKSSSGLAKLAKVAGVVGGAITAFATGSFIKGGIDRALNIEQAEYKLKQLGLDVKAVMASANEAVTGTAHSLDAAATTAASLAASGVEAGDNMTNSLKAVAGMATLSGRSMSDIGLIFGKVAAQGRLQGDELMQFAESGVNATAALSKALGKSQADIREMVKNGEIDFQTFADAMYQSFGQAAYGANETFTGALSNVNAALSRMSEKFAKPALDSLKGVFQNAIPAINALSTSLEPLAAKFGEFVAMLGERASSGLQKFVEVLNQTQNPLKALKAAIAETFGADLGGAINAVIEAFQTVGSVVGNAIQWFVSLDSGTQRFIATVVALGAAFRPLISLLASGASKVIGFAQSLSSVGSFLGKIGSNIHTASSSLNQLNSSTKAASSAVKQMSSSIRPAINDGKLLAQGFTRTSTSIQKFAGSAKSTSSYLKTLNSSTNAVSTKMKYLDAVTKSSATSFRTTGVAAAAGAVGIQATGTAAQSASIKVRMLSSAANVLKGALASIGVAAVVTSLLALGAAAVDGFQKAAKNAENFKKATSGLEGLADNYRATFESVKSGFDSASDSASKFGESVSEAARTAQEAAEAGAEVADKLNQSFSDAATKNAMVEQYEKVIERLANAGRQLTQTEQGELANAVAGLNEILGTNIQIIDSQTGALDQSTQSILSNADAWQQQALAQVAAQANMELLQRNFELQKDLDGATQNYNDTLREYNEVMEASGNGTRLNAEQQQYWTDKLSNAKSEVEGIQNQIDSNNKAMQDNTELAGEMAAQYGLTSNAISEFINNNQELSARFSEMGIDIDKASQKFQEWGLSLQDVSNLTPEALAIMSQNWDASLADIVAACDAAGIAIPDALRSAIDQAAVAMADGSQEVVNNAEQAVQGVNKTWQNLGDGMVDSAGRIYDEFGNVVDVVKGSAAEVENAGLGQAMVSDAEKARDALQSVQTECDTTLSNIKSKFTGLEGELTSIGVSLGNALSTGFAQADMMSTQIAIQNMVMNLSMRAPELMAIGTSWGNALSTGFSMADMASAYMAVDMLFMNLNMKTFELMAMGISWANSLSTGFATADMASTYMAIDLLMMNLSMRTVELQAIGLSYGNSFSTGFASADMASAYVVIERLVAAVSGRNGEFFAIGVSLGNALSSGFASADMASATARIQSLIGQINSYEGQYNSTGLSHGNAYSTGFASADMASTISRIESLISQILSFVVRYQDAGRKSGQAYGQGIQGSSTFAISAARSLASSAVAALSTGSGNAFGYGSHLGSQFAAGISSQASAVRSAAASLAEAAKANIGFSHPDEGPLRFGTEIYGKHLVEQFAGGMDKRLPAVSTASVKAAKIVSEIFSRGINSFDFEPVTVHPSIDFDRAAQNMIRSVDTNVGSSHNIYIDGIHLEGTKAEDFENMLFEMVPQIERLANT